MNRNIVFASASAVLLSAVALASEATIKMKDLPAAVRKTVEEQSQVATLQGSHYEAAATLKAKFPGATITSATKATENAEVIYDIEMKKDGRKHEMDVKENGAIVNFENEIAVKFFTYSSGFF